MRLPSALLRSLVLGIVLLTVTAPHPAQAWDGTGGELAVLRLDDGRIDAPDDAVWLLGWNQDLAVLLVPSAWQTPTDWKPRLTRLEAPVHGAYYLVLCEDAQRLRVADPARALARHGHTVLAHTTGAPPAIALDGSHGLLQPVRLDLNPKPWPSAATTELADNFAIDFDPLVGEIAAQVDEAGYVAVWQALDDFETRFTFTAQNEAAANWMYDVLTSYGLEVEFHVYQQSGPKKNVVATIPGTAHPEQVVYMTGHFDSVSPSAETSAPGADDNGSGTAAFLEAARVLAQYEFENTIKLVGFNGEEEGLVGSSAYVSAIANQGEQVIGCFNLDMVAYRGNDPGPADLYIYTDPSSLPLATMLVEACETFTPGLLEPVVVQQILNASDHASFWSHGYRAILGIEGEVWGDDFCPWYHTTNDRIEQYPHDYPTWCTRATTAAVAQMAVPVGAPVTVESPFDPSFALWTSANPGPRPALHYALTTSGPVRLAIYDGTGRALGSVLEQAASGAHTVEWESWASARAPLPAGIYWVRLEALHQDRIVRLTVVR